MLSRLHIKNYALIDSLDISFDEHLNILTGETGAGKSIILGALGLILGQRAEGKYFFNQQKKCIIEGFFKVKNYQLNTFFEENDLDYEEETVLRREISLDGKSRAFINDTPVNLTTLKQVGEQLIDIHSQHATLEISNQKFQLLVVDLMANHQELIEKYTSSYKIYKKKVKQLDTLIEQSEKEKAELDYLQFQFDELEQAKLSADEQDHLEQELERLNHAEEIKSNLLNASTLLQNQEVNALNLIKEASNQLQQAEKYQQDISALGERLKSCLIEIKDIASEVEDIEQTISFDENKAALVSERLDLIYSLQKKHRVNSNQELLNYQEELSSKLNKILFADEDIERLQKEIQEEKLLLVEQAKTISLNRKNAIPAIEEYIIKILAEIGMANADVKLEQLVKEENNFDQDGLDQIKFLFSANKGHQLQELSKVASGGELSRLMLSIKSLIAKKTALPTIIFDEIDTGVSGEVAHKVGNIMEKLAEDMQVITITHLPQMASKGKSHYFVYKEIKDDFTYSQIKKLNNEERILEIAKMLSGEHPKESAIQNAKELLFG
ncbi:DNA repair protein RecN [Pedobacter glucosidilyticus]|uniref:DNA repair protein RecN n=1 Tax=Pedobacter aquae TaxID=2605747 RepID=A0A5C0VLC5_9SPHI|nr:MULTISPECIES: DNA repair protein RecN [Pedobacter]KHJ37395.1 DNA repair protein RecN [Pedobacter glucosidilyticus]QEK51784.1 DNA repair protein RecN [Pedobacter aquae]